MKQAFEEVHDVVRRRAQEMMPVDRIANIKRFGFLPVQNGNGLRHELRPLMQAEQSTVPPMKLRDHALHQLCSRVGVPYDFLMKCPEKLQLLNVNHFIQNVYSDEKRFMFRTVEHDQLRAIMSERFTAFDDAELFEAMAEYCQGSTVEAYTADERSTHVRLTFPGTEKELRKGDVVKTGLHITNSEVGVRSVTIHAMLYRLICTNGMIAADSGYWARHMGKLENLQQGVRSALEEAKYSTESLTVGLKQAMEIELKDPTGAMETLAKTEHMTQDGFKGLLNAYLMEPEPTAYGVVNAITRHAQSFEGAEDRYQTELIASRYLLKETTRAA